MLQTVRSVRARAAAASPESPTRCSTGTWRGTPTWPTPCSTAAARPGAPRGPRRDRRAAAGHPGGHAAQPRAGTTRNGWRGGRRLVAAMSGYWYRHRFAVEARYLARAAHGRARRRDSVADGAVAARRSAGPAAAGAPVRRRLERSSGRCRSPGGWATSPGGPRAQQPRPGSCTTPMTARRRCGCCGRAWPWPAGRRPVRPRVDGADQPGRPAHRRGRLPRRAGCSRRPR